MNRPRAGGIAAIAVAVVGAGAAALVLDVTAARYQDGVITDGYLPWPFNAWDAGLDAAVLVPALFVWAALLIWVALSPPRLGVAGWIAVTVTAVVGTGLGRLVVRATDCCAYAYHVVNGYPWPWLGHGLSSDDPLTLAQLRRLLVDNPAAFTDRLLPANLLADVLFWSSVALLVVLGARWARHHATGVRADSSRSAEA